MTCPKVIKVKTPGPPGPGGQPVFKRLTTAQWAATNPVLLAGEPGIEVQIGGIEREKRGDGVTPWQQLPYVFSGVGGGQGGASYTFNQTTPAITWTINHNLGFFPSVELLSPGLQEIDGEISHTSINQTIVTLQPAFAGLALLR